MIFLKKPKTKAADFLITLWSQQIRRNGFPRRRMNKTAADG